MYTFKGKNAEISLIKTNLCHEWHWKTNHMIVSFIEISSITINNLICDNSNIASSNYNPAHVSLTV